MKRIALLSLFCLLILFSFSSCPELFKDMEYMIIKNESDSTIAVFVDDEYKNTVAPGTKYKFGLYTKVSYTLMCRADPYQWGPITVRLEKGEPYKWVIENLHDLVPPPALVTPEPTPESTLEPTPEPTPEQTSEPTPVRMGVITINNYSSVKVTIYISGEIVGTISAESSNVYVKEIGNYDLAAIPREIHGSWEATIDLTEEGYIWNLKTNSEPYPSENCNVWNFENNYNAYNASDDWRKVNVDFSSLYKKFGRFSLTATPGNDGTLSTGTGTTVGKSQAAGFWTYIEITDGEDIAETTISIFKLMPSVKCAGIQVRLQKQEYSNDFKFILFLQKQRDSDSIVIEDKKNSNSGTWNYIGFVYNAGNDEMFFCVNNRTIRSGKLGGSWSSILLNLNYYFILSVHPFNSYITTAGFLLDVRIDELLFCPDQYLHPRTLVDHYNNNVPWGEYVP